MPFRSCFQIKSYELQLAGADWGAVPLTPQQGLMEISPRAAGGLGEMRGGADARSIGAGFDMTHDSGGLPCCDVHFQRGPEQ